MIRYNNTLADATLTDATPAHFPFVLVPLYIPGTPADRSPENCTLKLKFSRGWSVSQISAAGRALRKAATSYR